MVPRSGWVAWLRSRESNWLTIPLWGFFFSRMLVFIALYAPLAMGISLGPYYNADVPALDIVTRWDSVWYIEIAENGYRYLPDATTQQDASVNFYPMYPLLLVTLESLVGNIEVTGLLMSNLFFLGSLILLYLLTEEMLGRKVAEKTVFYLCIFPTSFFFSMIYSESLFLFATLLCYFSSRRGRWGLVAVSGAVASATRNPGIFIAITAAFEWLRINDLRPHTILSRRGLHQLWEAIQTKWLQAALICLIPAGALAYMIYLQLQFGNAFAFLDAAELWGRSLSNPIDVVYRDFMRAINPAQGTHNLPYFDLINIVVFLACLLLVIPTAHKLGIGLALYCLVSLLLPGSTKMEAIIRYVVVLFPFFMMLGYWGKSKAVHLIYVTISLLLLLLFTNLFANNIFVA